jgi:hypothetical protein
LAVLSKASPSASSDGGTYSAIAANSFDDLKLGMATRDEEQQVGKIERREQARDKRMSLQMMMARSGFSLASAIALAMVRPTSSPPMRTGPRRCRDTVVGLEIKPRLGERRAESGGQDG